MAHRWQTLLHRARAMRGAPTRGEDRLWRWLRGRHLAGVKFRRQVPIARYIVDFYCVELKLALEIDGNHHSTDWMADYDTARTRALMEKGIRVHRIANELLARDPQLVEEGVLAVVAELLAKR